MRIEKIDEVIPLKGAIVGQDSTGTDKTYNVDYINSHSVVVSPTEPSGSARKKVWKRKNIKNLFNPTLAFIGYELQGSNGSMSANSNWYVSPYIKVKGNTNYTISATNKTIGNSNCWYDENKNFISTTSSIVGTITSPSNAQYLRFNGKLDEIEEVQLEEGSTATAYEPYVEDKEYILNSNDVYEEFIPQNEVYSTNEQVIGTYMGKPLYGKYIKKTVNHTASTGTTKYEYSLNIAHIDTIFIDRGKSFANNGVTPLDNIFFANQAIVLFSRAAINTNTLTYDVFYNNTTTIPIDVYICYTKTTD